MTQSTSINSTARSNPIQEQQKPALSKTWKTVLIVSIVLTILSVLVMLGSMAYLIVSGVPLCSLSTIYSWIFLCSMAASILTMTIALSLHTAALCKIKSAPTTIVTPSVVTGIADAITQGVQKLSTTLS